MANDIKEILKSATKDLLTEETLTQIETVFKESVDKKAGDKAGLQLEAALTAQDEKHTVQLQTLLEKIDSDHAKKLEKIVQAINESHLRKLKAVIARYQSTINEEAKQFKDKLVSSVSNYLELYLEKVVPISQIQEAVKTKKAERMLTEMRKMLGVDLAFSQTVIKEGLADGKNQLSTLAKEKEELVKENVEIKAKAEKAEATLLLEQKTAGMPKEKKAYVLKLLGEKTPDFITENFDYTVSMFDKEQQTLLESLKKDAKPVSRKVDRPVAEKKDEVINESAKPEGDPQLTPYMQELSKY